MARLRRLLVTASLGMIGGAVLMLASPAAAHNTAVRCTGYGCDYVHCDYTGDRCYRTSDEERYSYGRYYDGDEDGGYRRWQYVCDSDGDRCYRSSGSYWNYREYYSRQGYRWTPRRGHDDYGYENGYDRRDYSQREGGYGGDRSYSGDYDRDDRDYDRDDPE